MDPDFAQARELFERCITLDPASREACLSGETVTPALRARVEAMLRADASSSPLLDGGAARMLGETFAVPDADTLPPPRSRDFEILRELGRGGMGAVWLARQAAPRRLVALKRIGTRSSQATRERFRLEADALARLQHPGIAAIFGLGQDEAGEPFLVMEYVDGAPLARHAAALDVPGRLRLLAEIADAVDHAHSRGVIHRDLKPGNVLVTQDGHPKVLDFGIARLAASDTEHAALTQEGTLLGTPAYMSPEQAAGGAEATPASDVYALGVIGFELLGGRLPVPVSGLSPLLALRAIAHDAPPPLSRVVPALRGDLDSVFATALAKDPSARYASAAAFADDLRRVLAHEPVRARRPTPWQRGRLFARRNPALAASLVLAFFALASGTIAATWFALGERGERLRAELALMQARAERDRADSTLRFLAALLAEANPARSGKPDVAVRDVLDRALPRVEALPEVAQAPLLLVLADALSGFGANRTITPLYERAVALSQRYATPRETRAAQARLGTHLLDVGRVVDARDRLRDVLAHGDELDARDRRRAMADLGRAEAQLGNEAATRDLRERLRAEPGPPLAPGEVPPELLIAAEELRLYSDYGDGERLGALYDDVMPRATALLGADHPFVLALGRHEAAVRFHRRDDEGSLAAARRSVERHRAVLGETHAETLRARALLGAALGDQGLLPDSLAEVEATRALARQVLPEASALHLELLAQEVLTRHYSKQYDPLLAEGPALYQRFCTALAARLEYCGLLAFGLALAHSHHARFEESAHWMQQADAFLTERVGPDNPLLVVSFALLAQQHALADRPDRAEPLAQRAASMLDRRTDLASKRYAGGRVMLAFAYARMGKPELALPLARTSVEVDAANGWVPMAPSARVLSMALAGVGQRDVAVAVLERAWQAELSRPVQRQDRTDLARAFVQLAADGKDRAAYRRWARELQAQVAAGGYVPVHDTVGRQALESVAR